MSAFQLHGATANSPSIQGNAWQNLPSDQQSKISEGSVSTVQRAANYRPSSGSVCSLGSSSSARLRVGNENLAARRNASQPSLMLSPCTANSSSLRRASKQLSHRSSWENFISSTNHEQRISSLLAEAGPLEDIDLNAGCGESLYSSYEMGQDTDNKDSRGLSFDIRKQETLSTTPRLPSNASRVLGGPRSLNIATEQPVKSENPVTRLIGTLRAQGPKRRHSLTVRKERWMLDDFDDAKPPDLDLLQSRRFNGHQKASSWSSSGIRNVIKSATVRLQSATNRAHSPMFSRTRNFKSRRGSRISNAASRVSMDGDPSAARMVDRAARDRAVQRRQILEELISSEESYVADLKVLLHVSGPHGSSLESKIADCTLKVYLFMLNSAPKGPQATQPEITQNVADMLRLHEDILLEMKALMQGSHLQPDASPQQQSKHRRWYSVESTEAPLVEPPLTRARPVNDFYWFGLHRSRNLVTTPREAADIARIFERMVWKLHHTKL